MASDVEVREMINHLNENDQVEILVIIQDGNEDWNHSTDGLLTTHCEDDGALSIGTRFNDSNSFKFALRSQAIIHNFGVKIKASDKKRVIAMCAYRGCPWRIRASLCADGQTFEVKKLNNLHSCPGVNRAGNKQATSSWVANEIQDIVKKYPDIPPKQINNTMETNYGLSLPYKKLWRSRELARDMIFGSVDENYSWVPTLCAELLKRNPGSHILYTLDSDCISFQRFFVSFKVCIDGFLVGCRHLIGLDACHLKSKYLGVLLSANSLDGNQGLFTLAFAVVETESKKTWQWFLENLGEVLGYELYPLAFISDMEKGLGDSIRQIFPHAEHRVCLSHLWKNMKKYFHCQEGQKVQSLVWSAANAYMRLEFEQNLSDLLNVSPTIHSYLLSLPYKWSKSQFIIDIKNDSNTNNMSESFNSWIVEARSKPVVDLVDMIRGMLMKQRANRKENAASWRGELTPYAEEYIREVTTKKEHFIIRQSTLFKAEVEGRQKRYEVDINLKECSCITWQMTGLPCIHATAFIGMKEHPLWNIYVDDHYHAIRYKMAYEGAITTLPDKEQWDVLNDGVQIDVPNTSRPRGRPRKRRLRSLLEKDKKVHKCSRCLLWGHHRSTCKNALPQASGSISIASTSIPKSSARPKLAFRKTTISDDAVVMNVLYDSN